MSRQRNRISCSASDKSCCNNFYLAYSTFAIFFSKTSCIIFAVSALLALPLSFKDYNNRFDFYFSYISKNLSTFSLSHTSTFFYSCNFFPIIFICWILDKNFCFIIRFFCYFAETKSVFLKQMSILASNMPISFMKSGKPFIISCFDNCSVYVTSPGFPSSIATYFDL